MINVDKHIHYWKNSAEEDLSAAENLITAKKIRHGLFFLHLALEKALKAVLCKQIKDIPPRTHNLVRLSELMTLKLNDEQIDFLTEMNPFNMEGRYPENLVVPPSQKEAENYLNKSTGFYRWLINQL